LLLDEDNVKEANESGNPNTSNQIYQKYQIDEITLKNNLENNKSIFEQKFSLFLYVTFNSIQYPCKKI
jgi:hypothetical protein